MEDIRQEQIDRYIRGEMTSEERSLFERKLSEDKELSEMYHDTMRVREALKDRNEKLDKINKWKTENRKTGFHRTPAGRFVYIALGAAAVIIMMLMLVNRKPAMPELDIQKYECYRGANSVLHVAELIENEEYESALLIIEKEKIMHKTDIDSIKRQIPKASVEAVDRMEYEISAITFDYEELQWLKVYALMGLERYDEAEILLKQIVTEKGQYKEAADSLLQQFPL